MESDIKKNGKRIKNLKQKKLPKSFQDSRQRLLAALGSATRYSTNGSPFKNTSPLSQKELTSVGSAFPIKPIKLLEKRE